MYNTDILPDKLYSIREAAKLIPGIKCAPTLQKTIDADVKKTGGQNFKFKVLKRNRQKRYYIKGQDLIDLIKKITVDKNGL
jgi:hypothetical protein